MAARASQILDSVRPAAADRHEVIGRRRRAPVAPVAGRRARTGRVEVQTQDRAPVALVLAAITTLGARRRGTAGATGQWRAGGAGACDRCPTALTDAVAGHSSIPPNRNS